MRNTWQFVTHDGRPLHIDRGMVAGIELGAESRTVALAIGNYAIAAKLAACDDDANDDVAFARLIDAWQSSDGRPDILELWRWDAEDGYTAPVGIDLQTVQRLAVYPGGNTGVFEYPPHVGYADACGPMETLWLKLEDDESFEAARDALMKRWRKARGEQ